MFKRSSLNDSGIPGLSSLKLVVTRAFAIQPLLGKIEMTYGVGGGDGNELQCEKKQTKKTSALRFALRYGLRSTNKALRR